MRRTIARIVAVAASTTLLLAGATTPVQAQVLPLPGFQSVAAWGDNIFGQLGDGTTFLGLTPVTTLGVSGATKVAAGRFHSLAITSGGKLWTWGLNTDNQLGHSFTEPFVTVPKELPLTGVIDAAGGEDHSLAVTSDGRVWAWGNNDFGQLGHGISRVPDHLPTRVRGLTDVVAVAAGHDFSLALRSDGTVWGWGRNLHGQLPGVTLLGGHTFEPAQLEGLSNVVAIAAGARHGVALVAEPDGSRTVYTWGHNAAGQLGDVDRCVLFLCIHPVPQPVPELADIVSIAAGNTTSAAIGSDGTVFTWGALSNGDPVSGDLSVTVRRLPSHQGVSVGVGYNHMVVVRPDGTAVAWGLNDVGQLGDPTVLLAVDPVQVVGLTRAKQVAAGDSFSLAVVSRKLIVQP